MVAITVAPAGGSCALPLLLGVATGVGDGGAIGVGVPTGAGVDPVVVDVFVDVEELEVEADPELLETDDDDDPAEVEEAAVPEPLEPAVVNAVVVVPGDLVKAFDPPHPVIEKAAIMSAAIVHKSGGFSRINDLSAGELPAVRSK